MKKNITLFSKNNMYAYNFRNKLFSLGWNIEYFNEENLLLTWLKTKDVAIIFVDNDDSEIIEKVSLLKNFNNFLIVYLDEKKNLKINNQSNMVCCLSNITKFLPGLEQKYNLILKNLDDTKNVYNLIIDKLSKFSISKKYKGYYYLLECIYLTINTAKNFFCYNSEIYPLVANKYNVSTGSIEKSIRMAIKNAYGKFPELFELEYLTNNEFMNYIREKILYDMI